MTSRAAEHDAPRRGPTRGPLYGGRRLWSRPVLADVAVGATLVWWVVGLTLRTGGREPHDLSVGCALLLLAYAAVAPWRVVPRRVLLVAHAIGIGALVVVLAAPTGGAGADDVASYVFAGQLLVVLWAWADGPRRAALLAVVAVAGGAEFAFGWLPWWGGGDQTRPFVGSFYWHNPAGALLAAAVVAACALVTAGRPYAVLGWALGPLSVAGLLFTTSRGAQAGLVIGLVILLALLRRNRLRVFALVAVGVGVATILCRPPFFEQAVLPWQMTTDRTFGASSSLGENGISRLEYWHWTWQLFGDRPFVGTGFNGFDEAVQRSGLIVGSDAPRTSFVHNGYLQVLADGGLVLFLPLAVGLGLLVLTVLRGLPDVRRRGDVVRAGGAAVLVVVLLHSGMDFDWAYPSLLALTAIAAVAALPSPSRHRVPTAGPALPRGWADRTIVLLGAALLAAAVPLTWSGGLDLTATWG